MTEKYITEGLTLLPKLPLPKLDQTFASLKKWRTPLLGVSEQNKLADQLDAFQKSDAVELQSYLNQRWVETNANWLSPILRHHYLSNRQPVQTKTNFGFTISHDKLPHQDQLTITAKLLQNFADQYLSYVTGTAPVEKGSDDKPIDMSSYLSFFRTQRQPGVGHDYLQKTRHTVNNVEATVIYHQTVYQIRLIDHAGRVSTLHSLTEALTQMMNNPDPDTFFIGAYTGLPRNDAAKLRQRLSSSELNQANLTRMSDSLLTVTLLDPSQSLTPQSVLLGSQNQLFDKTTQVIVSSDAQIGFAFEHSQIDVQIALKLVNSVVTKLDQPADQWDSKGKPHFQRLEWQLDHYTKEALSEADRRNAEVAQRLEFASKIVQAFGVEQLQDLGVNPDAFVQISLALAEYRITGSWQNISESISMRQFYQGRTETASTITPEEKQFIEAFAAGARDAATRQLFNQAVTALAARMNLIQQGFGIDSHLLGLVTMMSQYGGKAAFPDADEFFHSPFLNQLVNDFFSTVRLPTDLIDTFVSSPASPNGYTIGYSPLKNQIALSVSAWTSNDFEAEELLADIEDSLSTIFAWLTAERN